jgi:predicted nuclease of predicted toxin-antitoxin system
MKVLLDENLPHALRAELPDHDVFTVQYLGWSGTKNGLLLAKAADSGFDVMVTMDSGVAYQQNRAVLPLAVIILEATSNDIDDLRPLMARLRQAVKSIKPGTVVRIAH